MQSSGWIMDFSDLNHKEIAALLVKHQLALTPDEALHIQQVILKRPPSLAECHLWSIQGSEHCSYKSSRQYLQGLPTHASNVLLGPKEDAGIICIATDSDNKRYGLVISHESHNHPSQIVPYEGAATGVGGNIRDVSCMGAEVIALADGLRFGSLNQAKTHWIAAGVVAGIGEYGNAAGIPNIAGDVYFDEAYNQNCLVTVVTLGIVREEGIIHSFAPRHAYQHVYILVGKATDNSGFGGASFASARLDEEETHSNKGAVQEPNAFLKRHLLKANQALFAILAQQQRIQDVGFKDLGAGGVACASVEMAEAAGLGAEIMIDSIPTSINQLAPHVILCSETQERFMWLVPPDLVETILHHYNERFALPDISYGAQAAIIGKITNDQYYRVYYQGQLLVEALAADITQGIRYERPYTINTLIETDPALPAPSDFNAVLLSLLAHENIASRSPIIETYDKQVQGRTLLEAGQADGGLIQPFNDARYPEEIRTTGVVLALDHNPRYNKIDAYWGAVNAVVEAARNVVAVGASPQAITDCLCFGNPENTETMGHFLQAVEGIRDACQAVGLKEFPEQPLPVIAGNVSFYNESQGQAIPPSPMISCVGRLADVKKALSPHFTKNGHTLILIGERKDECGGSVYYQLLNQLGTALPKPNLKTLKTELWTILEAIDQGLVCSAHDISDGGLAVTLAEMSFNRLIGVDISIPGALADEKKLFGETGGFVLEIAPQDIPALTALFTQNQLSFSIIGQTIAQPVLLMQNKINLPITLAKKYWENGLREKLS